MTAAEFKTALARNLEAAMHGIAAYGKAALIVVEQTAAGDVIPLASASPPDARTGVVLVLK